MNFLEDVFKFNTEHLGLAEIAGPADNRMIEVAHYLCKVESEKGGESTDEIPWCSAWQVLAFVCVNIRRNPYRTKSLLQKRNITSDVIKELFAFAKVSYDLSEVDTNIEVVEPTWSASSLSWDKWGNEVPMSYTEEGDMVRLTRDGGGHIAQYVAFNAVENKILLLGGNQGNKISKQWFDFNRVVHVRHNKES